MDFQSAVLSGSLRQVADHEGDCAKCHAADTRLLGATWGAQAAPAVWYFRCDACGWVWTVVEDRDGPSRLH
jgi:hypothetical protein